MSRQGSGRNIERFDHRGKSTLTFDTLYAEGTPVEDQDQLVRVETDFHRLAVSLLIARPTIIP